MNERDRLMAELDQLEMPTRLGEIRKEWFDKSKKLIAEVAPFKNHDGTRDLSEMTSLLGKDVSGLTPKQKAVEVKKISGELSDLLEEGNKLEAEWNAKRKIGKHRLEQAVEALEDGRKSDNPGLDEFCERFVKAFKEKHNSGNRDNSALDFSDIDVRNLMTTDGGHMTPTVTPSGRFHSLSYQEPMLRELLPNINISEAGYWYKEEYDPASRGEYNAKGKLVAGANPNRVTVDQILSPLGNARTVGEGTLYPEEMMYVRDKFASIDKVGTMAQVTEEQLADAPAFRQFMESRMLQRQRRKIDLYVLYGQGQGTHGARGAAPQRYGTAPGDEGVGRNDGLTEANIKAGTASADVTGDESPVLGGLERLAAATMSTDAPNGSLVFSLPDFDHAGGFVPAKRAHGKTGGGDHKQEQGYEANITNLPNLIHWGFTAVRTRGFAQPRLLIMNPEDWHFIRTMQTAEGVYLFGPPTTEGEKMLWGVSIMDTLNVVRGTAWTGDFAEHISMLTRTGLAMEYGYVNDQFARDTISLKMRERLGLAVFRPQAFLKFTGIPQPSYTT